MNQTPIARAIASTPGGQKSIAQALKIDRSLVSQWVTGRRPVAAEHCPTIERLSGVRCEHLRPDVLWTRNTSGVVTGYHVPIPPPEDARSEGVV
jgi:DNA-binding transcriptional regulator YdaS (Cro superfamily)